MKMLVALHQVERGDIVKRIHSNTADAYCDPGTVQIFAVGDR